MDQVIWFGVNWIHVAGDKRHMAGPGEHGNETLSFIKG
jgi:hypothetical protein